MAARVEDGNLVLSDEVEKVSRDTSSLQCTAKQIPNMKPDIEKTPKVALNSISNGTANGITQAPVKNSAETLEFPMPIVTFAPGLGVKGKEPHEEEDIDSMNEGQASDKRDLPAEKPTEDKTKKKRKKKKKPAPTGFEDYYAEPPITPAEFEEEQEVLYEPSRHFVERIETCIQRYRAKRKLDSLRSNVFTKYLILGGVDAGVKAFGSGLDKDLLLEGTKDDIARANATDYIGFNRVKFYHPSNSEHWVVDFEGVVKGFLSHKIFDIAELDTEQNIKICCGVIRNFLNYILLHGVCPEYTQQLMCSRIICDKAEKELWAIHQLNYLLPDSFNMACSTIYGGHFKNKYLPVGDPWRPADRDIAEFGIQILGMEDKEAQRIFKTAISLIGTEEMFRAVVADTIYVAKKENVCLEMVEIIRADPKVQHAFSQVKDFNGKLGGMKALGKLILKQVDDPVPYNEDCSDDGIDEPISSDSNFNSNSTYEFWIEDNILKECIVGMKMRAVVHELNIGLKYFDEIHGVFCSFHTVLPQERMDLWKEPVLNTRGPPTVDNPTRLEEEEEEEEEGELQGGVEGNEA